MEIFRYTTTHAYEKAEKLGFLTPHYWQDKVGRVPLYFFPEDPMLWGLTETMAVLKHIEMWNGHPADILLKLKLPDLSDIQAFVQEGQIGTWDKKLSSKKPINEYRKGEYHRPEVIIWDPIPVDSVSLIEFPEILRIKQQKIYSFRDRQLNTL